MLQHEPTVTDGLRRRPLPPSAVADDASASAAERRPTEKLSSAAYTLISLPLGIVSFVLVVAGVSISVGLTPVFIGLPILLAFLLALRSWMRFERKLARSVLGHAEDAAPAPAADEAAGWLRKLGGALRKPSTYSSLLYGVLKLPIGIFLFTVSVVLTCVSIAFLLAPVVYWTLDQALEIDIFAYSGWTRFIGLDLTPLQESLMYSALGFALLLVSLYVIRSMAAAVAKLTLLFTEEP